VPSVRNNGRVEKLDIPPDKLEEAKKFLNSARMSSAMKRDLMRELKMGRCCVCENFATHKVSYDIDGATLIERYCEKCVSHVLSHEHERPTNPEDYGIEIGDIKQV